MATMNATPFFTRSSRKLNSIPAALHTATSLSSINTTTSSTVKPSPSTVQSASNSTVRPRTSTSIDRKRRIEKSDISCPFRCSCDDLVLAAEETPETNSIRKLQQVFTLILPQNNLKNN